ncbi:MAG: LamG-like jellyroll fold domain-containing protein, partial [Nitrosopumilaceae archaeon]
NSTTTLPAGNSTSPSAEDQTPSADISATTTPVGNSTTTLPAGNSTSPSAEDPTLQTESVPDNFTSNEITQPLPDATLSLQFDDFDTQTSDVAGDATVEEKLNVTSLNLDGEGDFVQVTDTGSSKELTAMSLLAWVKPDYSSGSSEFTVVSKDKTFVLAINNNIPPSKIAKFSIFDGIKWSTVESTTQIKEEWTHLAATFDGSSIGIYVNGNLESTLPITGILSLTVNGQLELITVDSISSDSDIVIGAYLSEKSG